jgi:hypothetical protein
MTDPDPVTILEWYIKEHGTLRPGAALVKVEACLGYFDITAPSQEMMLGLHHVMKIAKPVGATVYLHDLLVVLEAIR